MVEKNDIQYIHVVEREITLFSSYKIMSSTNGSAVAYIDLASTRKYCIPALS